MDVTFERKGNILIGYCKIIHEVQLPPDISEEDIRIVEKEDIKLELKRKVSDMVFNELSHNGELMLGDKKVRVSMFCPEDSIIIGDKTMESFILSDIVRKG